MNDDVSEIREYVSLHCKRFMTEFELRCYYVGGRMAKAASSEFDDVREKARQWWDRYDDSDVKLALANGFDAFKSQVTERLFRDAVAGQIHINRCPRCRHIARTPLAKQCRYCYHDWRDA